MQEFNGIPYYKCGEYFSNSAQDNERRLHRAVWLAYHLSIPDGYHVHHIDGDRSNNQIENLLCLPADEHLREHGLENHERMVEMGNKYRHLTKEWHASEEGREWHRQHYAKNISVLYARHSANCSCCGTTFQASGQVKNVEIKYCSKACKAHARRKSGVDDITRSCEKCRAEFKINKYSMRKNCEACFPSRRNRRLLFDSA